MLTPTDYALLDNVLDALDRPFDSQSTATDLHPLLFATRAALTDVYLAQPFTAALREFDRVVQPTASRDERRDAALTATNSLRLFIAQALENTDSKIVIG